MEIATDSRAIDLASINRETSDAVARQALINLRFETESGNIAISGIDALLRILVDQLNADSYAGLSTSALLTGYRGSPLGGVDIAYNRAKKLLIKKGAHFLNSINEELAATSIWGSQMSTMMDDPLFDGVLGMWYGKAPGVDRAGDALRHANMTGTDPKGGVLCVAGDDPECKSSTIPSATEAILADLNMPVLYPGSVQDVVDFGRFGYELSRASGLWVGFKIVTDIADAYSSVEVGPHRMVFSDAKFEVHGVPFIHQRTDHHLPPTAQQTEEELYKYRLPAAEWFIEENPIHQNFGAVKGDAHFGIVATGKACFDVLEALSALGLNEAEMKQKGIRVHKPGAIWPMDKASLKDFARGLKKILVVEEKKDMLQKQVVDTLYSSPDRPVIMSRRDEAGEPLLPEWGHFTPDSLMEPLARLLGEHISVDYGKIEKLREEAQKQEEKSRSEFLTRIPYYCSGCPHNRSTVVPDGSVAGGGIGCHTMSLFIPSRKAEGMTQMGGEGAQWVGATKFVETNHRFQNIGDGTLWHSGSLAIRQAVAANVDITYKILYNDAVAMTGGQDAAGAVGVPELSRMLRAEGVKDIIVVTEDVNKYSKKEDWASGVEVKDRRELDEVQRYLREIPGVTALIYDQACAAEVRRRRKRGQLPIPEERVFVNESACEDCGDCSKVSNCLSLFEVDTPLGKKIQIHQDSCNVDLTCMEGNCPSFVTVKVNPKQHNKNPQIKKLDDKVAEPKSIVSEANIMSVGIGGTGVLTVNQIIATAAFLDGKYVNAMDQTGLSQKGGTVASHLKISSSPIHASNRIGQGQADAILMFDILAGVDILDKANPDKTIAVGSISQIPTGEMIADRSLDFPSESKFHSRIAASTRNDENFWLDAERIADKVFKSQPASNVIVLGAAYQKGLIPARAESIEKAFRLNGVAVSNNLAAFRLGRKLVVEPDYIKKLMSVKEAAPITFINKRENLDDLIKFRHKELIKYQNAAYAKSYSDFVAKVREIEAELSDKENLTRTVAIQLHRLMAYKDEYEVARLSLERSFKRQLVDTFGKRPKVTFHLQPPSISKLIGLKKKIAVPGRVAKPMFRVLTRMKVLRGSFMDPFGHSKERKLERRLIQEYKELVKDLLAQANSANENPASYEKIVEIVGLANIIRGYDTVKLGNVEIYRAELKTKLLELASIEKEEVLVSA